MHGAMRGWTRLVIWWFWKSRIAVSGTDGKLMKRCHSSKKGWAQRLAHSPFKRQLQQRTAGPGVPKILTGFSLGGGFEMAGQEGRCPPALHPDMLVGAGFKPALSRQMPLA